MRCPATGSPQGQELGGATFDAMARHVVERHTEHVTAADIERRNRFAHAAYEVFRERAGTSPADYPIEHRVTRAEEPLADASPWRRSPVVVASRRRATLPRPSAIAAARRHPRPEGVCEGERRIWPQDPLSGLPTASPRPCWE